MSWHPIETAPKDGSEIMLWYADWLGSRDFVISGHWSSHEGREFEATWEHSLGTGDAEMWQPLPIGYASALLAQSFLDRSDEDWTFVDPEDIKTLARAVLGK